MASGAVLASRPARLPLCGRWSGVAPPPPAHPAPQPPPALTVSVV